MTKTKKVEVTPEEVKVEGTRSVSTYQVPETKEDLLNLYQCLKDSGINDLSSLEVRISRL